MDPAPASRSPDDIERRALLRQLFEQDFDYVWVSLRRLGVHARDREDVTQELFMRVFRHLDDYDPTRPSRPWLFAFAFRCASDWKRLARHRVEVLEGPTDSVSTAPSTYEEIARHQDRMLIDRALESIPLERRAVFILYELDECPMKEVAAHLRIPVFTAYSRLRVAREEFEVAVKRLRAKEERP